MTHSDIRGKMSSERTVTSINGLTASQQLVSSCSGALLTALFMTPLDVIKIRLQSQRKPQAFTKGHCYVYCNGLMDHTCVCLNGTNAQIEGIPKQQWYKRPGHFSGTFDAFIKIARHEGIRSLWSGLPPTLVMAVPATVVYFTTYEHLKAAIGHSYGTGSDWWKPAVAGASARVFAVTVISPIELVRTKMQSEQLTYRQVRQAVQSTIQKNGVLSMWRGLGPSLLRDVPFSASYWLGYESIKNYLLLETGASQLTFYESFLAGACSGTFAATLTVPFDVIKTHRQIELGEQVFSNKTKEVTSTWRLIQNLIRQQGVSAIFSGLAPRIIKVAPACAIMISSYEYCKKFFRNKNLQMEQG